LQRVRGDVREKGLNALRQFSDDVSNGRFPGLYLLITGTPAFFDGPQGVKRSAALAQRLHVDFGPTGEFDSSRAVQVRLHAFNQARLVEVGMRVRDIYPSKHPERIAEKVSNPTILALASAVAGNLGGKVGIAPRLFLKKLVSLLDQVEEHAAFDPAIHWQLKIDTSDMNADEREAAGIERSVDDIQLDLDEGGKGGGGGSGNPA
jgi:hypothetical protein